MPQDKYRFDAEIRKRLKHLTSLDNYHGPLAIAEDYLIITCAIAILWVSPFLYPLSILVIGARQRAFATLLHESAHKTLCKDRRLNHILGTWFSGYLIFQLSQPYRRSHILGHHQYLGNSDKDPDLQFHQKEGLYQPNSRSKFRWKFLIKPWLCAHAYSHLKYLLNARLRQSQATDSPAYRSELIRFLGLWGLLLTLIISCNIWFEFLLLWIVPYFTTFQAINWFCELSEHFPMPRQGALDIYQTRNRFSPPLEKFFFGIHGENYHLEHHLHPGIPFWNLAVANRARRMDKHYDQINAIMGGLFFRSKKGAPSAINTILNRLPDITVAASASASAADRT